MLRDASIEIADAGQPSNVSSGPLRALRLANIYLWALVPLKASFKVRVVAWPGAVHKARRGGAP